MRISGATTDKLYRAAVPLNTVDLYLILYSPIPHGGFIDPLSAKLQGSVTSKYKAEIHLQLSENI